jgi:hypothetical protein
MLQNGELHHPGDAGPGSGRAGGSRAKGEGDGDGTEDPTQHHKREEGDGTVLVRELGSSQQVRNIYFGTYFCCIK